MSAARCAFCLTAAMGLACARCGAPVHPGCALEHAGCPACQAPLDLAALAAALTPDDGWEPLGPRWEPLAFLRAEGTDEPGGDVRLRLEVDRLSLAAGSLLPLAVRVSGPCGRAGPLELELRRPSRGRWPFRPRIAPIVSLELGPVPRLEPGRWTVRLALRGIAPGSLEVVARLRGAKASAVVALDVVDPFVPCATS